MRRNVADVLCIQPRAKASANAVASLATLRHEPVAEIRDRVARRGPPSARNGNSHGVRCATCPGAAAHRQTSTHSHALGNRCRAHREHHCHAFSFEPAVPNAAIRLGGFRDYGVSAACRRSACRIYPGPPRGAYRPTAILAARIALLTPGRHQSVIRV